VYASARASRIPRPASLALDARNPPCGNPASIYTSVVIPSLENLDWRGFLNRPRLPSPPMEVFDALYPLPMLVTGAGGSIGSALSLRLSMLTLPRLVLLEASESNLYGLKRRWAQARAAGAMTPVLGSVADRPLIERIFKAHAPRIVFHTAAFKHVPLMEEHPLAAIANNVFGTETLVRVAAASGARVVLLSTDKAVEPASVMGASKSVAERIVLAACGTVLRLGNVLASSDSVAEIFAQQIAEGGPITVTDPAARRYFLTLDEAVNLLLMAAAFSEPCSLLAPVLPTTHFVSDLAHFLAETLAPGRAMAIDFTGTRPGDKDTEMLWRAGEPVRAVCNEAMVSIDAPTIPDEQLGAGLANLHLAAEANDLTAALAHLRWLVPDYRPSKAVLELARRNAGQGAP
jgi:FlaA1/EpsC-like NDP-sugar epimerase